MNTKMARHGHLAVHSGYEQCGEQQEKAGDGQRKRIAQIAQGPRVYPVEIVYLCKWRAGETTPGPKQTNDENSQTHKTDGPTGRDGPFGRNGTTGRGEQAGQGGQTGQDGQVGRDGPAGGGLVFRL